MSDMPSTELVRGQRGGVLTLARRDADNRSMPVARDDDARALRRRIVGMLHAEPMIRDGWGRLMRGRYDSYPEVGQCHREGVTFPRISSLHKMLCSTIAHPINAAVDDGPASYAQLSYVLAAMGIAVVVKEPAFPCVVEHREALETVPREVQRRISYCAEGNEIDRSTPADVAYWTNPDPTMLFATGAAVYLGRDVVPGGFLVIQTDLMSSSLAHLITPRWKPIVDQRINERGGIPDLVMPSLFSFTANRLIVMQRLTSPARL